MDTSVFGAFAAKGVPHVPHASDGWGTDAVIPQPIENVALSASVPHVPHVPPENDKGWDEEDRQAAFDERAAILEYDAGMSRLAAEAMARREIDEQRRQAG